MLSDPAQGRRADARLQSPMPTNFGSPSSVTHPNNIAAIQIGVNGLAVTVHLFGACTPTYCDWGEVEALAYGPSVSSDLSSTGSVLTSQYDFGFADVAVIIRRVSKVRLQVETFTHFKDSSGRSDYHYLEYFRPLRKNEQF